MGKDILFICDRCNALVEKGHTRYVLELSFYAGVDPLEIDERPSDFDYNREINRLIESMRGMDEIYLHDQVHMERTYYLCPACRDVVYREIFMERRPPRRTGAPDAEKEEK